MSARASLLSAAGRISGSRSALFTSTPQRRSTSWIAFEQPNPALYAKQPPSSSGNNQQQAAAETQGTRNIGETVSAPGTAATKLAPPSIQAESSHVLFSQTRGLQTESQAPPPQSDASLLPTTLLRIPGVTATWPAEASVHPDQKRVRKQRVINTSDEAPSSSSPLEQKPQEKEHASSPDNENPAAKEPEQQEGRIERVLSHVSAGLKALRENSSIMPRAQDLYEQGVREYASVVASAGAVVESQKDIKLGRSLVDEEDRKEWRRITRARRTHQEFGASTPAEGQGKNRG
ncbi:hypothetical protein AAE478_003560 [Parahypoxylon ruwenzoriense]